jgi:phosphatidylglycerol:prolipoprotein diacylglycerol transferase
MIQTLLIGPFAINTHVLLNLVAGAVAFGYGWQRLQATNIPKALADVVDAFFYALCGAVIGAWAAASLPALVLAITGHRGYAQWWTNGNQWMGVLGGMTLVLWAYYRRKGIAPGRVLDVGAPVLPLTQAVGRVGCILYGDAYGRLASGWPAMVLPDVNGVWASRYPTQLADLLANLAIFALLLMLEHTIARRARRGWPCEGFLFAVYIVAYSVQRFFFEFWRGDMPLLSGAFTWTHLYCVLAVGLTGWAIWRQWKVRPGTA